MLHLGSDVSWKACWASYNWLFFITSLRLKMEKSMSQFHKNSTSGFTLQRRGQTSRQSCSIPAKSFCQRKRATRLSWAMRRSRTTLSRRWRCSRPTEASTSSWCKQPKRPQRPKGSTRPESSCHSQKKCLYFCILFLTKCPLGSVCLLRWYILCLIKFRQFV